MTGIKLSISLALLVVSSTATIAAPQCAYDLAVDPSHYRGTRRQQQNRVDDAASGEICRAYVKQFIDAVTARKDAAACQDGVERRRALEALDVEIRASNERIAENSCEQ